MQKAHASILVMIVVVAVAVVVAEWYFFDHRPRMAEAAIDGDLSLRPPREESNLSGDTSNILECADEAGNTFYTDASSCEGARPPSEEENQP